MISFLSKINFVVEKKYRKKLLLILTLSLIVTGLEIMGIAMIIPILSIFVSENYLQYTEKLLPNKNKEEVFLIVLIGFIIIYLFKTFFIKSLSNVQFKLAHTLFANISRQFFEYYLYKNFLFHVQKNSAELIRNIQTETSLFSFQVVFPLMRLITELIVFFAILIMLIDYNFTASLITFSFFSIVGFIAIQLTNRKLVLWGKIRQDTSSLSLKQLQQSLSSIKEVFINSLREIFLEKYHKYNYTTSMAGYKRDTTLQTPRPVLELLGVVTFVFLILFLQNNGKNLSEILVIVGVFFFASVRILPTVSKIVNSIQSLKYNSSVVDIVYDVYSKYKENEHLIKKHKDSVQNDSIDLKEISIEGVSFSYPENKKKIFEKINYKIKVNEKIGLIGKTGSGKTTFINLLTGLVECNEGKIAINGTNLNLITSEWQKSIGYVPQLVSILDENILFNVTLETQKEKINFNKLDEVLKIVDLYDYIYSLPDNIYELAGERGEKFSGGQCQRLGIARALYKNPKILILDEATSSLDEKTENFILKKLFDEVIDKTILTISHRNSSLRFCDKVIEIKDSQLEEVKSNENRVK